MADANSTGVMIKVLENKTENWKLLLDAWFEFHENCPPSTAIRGLMSGEGKVILERSLCEMIQSGDCSVIIAWDTDNQQVAGICLHSVESRDDEQSIEYTDRPDTWKHSRFTWPPDTNNDIISDKNFWSVLGQKLDFFNRYSSDDRAWHIECLGVCKEYGGLGIGKRLVERSLELARQQNHTIVQANFASKFSQKIGIKCGFEKVFGAKYSEILETYHNMPSEVKNLHDDCVVMVKRLGS